MFQLSKSLLALISPKAYPRVHETGYVFLPAGIQSSWSEPYLPFQPDGLALSSSNFPGGKEILIICFKKN
jgi:hypothetical protein